MRMKSILITTTLAEPYKIRLKMVPCTGECGFAMEGGAFYRWVLRGEYRVAMGVGFELEKF